MVTFRLFRERLSWAPEELAWLDSSDFSVNLVKAYGRLAPGLASLNISWPLHFGSEQLEYGTTKFTFSHELVT